MVFNFSVNTEKSETWRQIIQNVGVYLFYSSKSGYCHMFQKAKARKSDASTNALSFENKKEPLTEAQVAV